MSASRYVRRVGVQFSASVLQCNFQCSDRPLAKALSDIQRVEWLLLLLAVACVTAVIVVALAGNIMLTVYQRRCPKNWGSYHPVQHSAAVCPPAAVTLLHVADDSGQACQARDLEKFLLSVGVPVKLFDLGEAWEKEALPAEPHNALAVLLWSKGCNQHLGRLVGGQRGVARPQMERQASATVKVDVVTYDSLTTAAGEVPSWLTAVPLRQLRELFTQTHNPAYTTPQAWPPSSGCLGLQSQIQSALQFKSCEKVNLL
ncbi:uncharacterized protein LOC118770702 [Megalops cyprinoides]|uniref:uncharacterized protein LOC118770702 n=1 Tax=Megalops cyprinoides TaxID=118141 RepID=UPI001863DF5A|nr:uncharacterized protein LOC118770702 [Megalops cyprinoides]